LSILTCTRVSKLSSKTFIPLRSGDKKNTEFVFEEIKSAFESLGAFYIKGHGIPVDMTNAILQQTRDFFSLPLEKKNALSFKDSKAFRGYFHKGKSNRPSYYVINIKGRTVTSSIVM
jgi:isopenicillin N synthase-like dioxygenase